MYGCGYEEIEEMMTARANVYPIELKLRERRDNPEAPDGIYNHPWASQMLEVQPKPRWPRGQDKSTVDPHRIEGQYLYAGRVLTHPSRVMAPNLIDGNQPQTFDRPHPIIAWAPNPIVQISAGQHTLSPDDMRHTVPKQLLGYSAEALSQQEIVDAAMLKVRQSMYGR